MLNWALWKKSIAEARWLLLACMVLVFAFHWLLVWVTSLISLGQLQRLLELLPDVAKQLSPVPLEQIATASGRIAIAYDHPIVLLTFTAWALARGSDAVAGELGRGTLEMVLAQPVTRLGVLAVHAAVTIGGAALLAASAWLGTYTGLLVVTLEQPAEAHLFVPAALNLFALTVFLAGLTTMFSAGDRYRGRTIGLVSGFYAISMVLKVIGRLAPGWEILVYGSFFTPFEPQMLVSDPAKSWAVWLVRDSGAMELGGLGGSGLLIALGLACYAIAALIFCQRDLPAPL